MRVGDSGIGSGGDSSGGIDWFEGDDGGGGEGQG